MRNARFNDVDFHTTVLGDATPCSLVKIYWIFKEQAVAVPLTAAASLSATAAHANNTQWHSSVYDKPQTREVSLHDMKGCKGSRGIAPFFLNVGTRWS